MASILRVNTLTDASSNNSVPMATVNQGTAKSWADFTMASTPSADDSFNLASITDVAYAKKGLNPEQDEKIKRVAIEGTNNVLSSISKKM